jgi:hypothetical protein
VPEPARRDLHPLLFEPRYWRERFAQQKATASCLLRVPRPDLSSTFCEVEELRFKAHDGVRLWGLIAHCTLGHPGLRARIRTLRACDPPSVDVESVRSGTSELLLQFPAGRRLEDRVLDVLRCCELAGQLESLPSEGVELVVEASESADEILIAQHLRSGGMLRA